MTPKLTTTIEWFDAITDLPKDDGYYLVWDGVIQTDYFFYSSILKSGGRFNNENNRDKPVTLWANPPKIEISEPIPYETNS